MSQTLLIITEPSAFHPITITKWYKFLSLIHNLYKRKTRNTLHVDQFHGFPFPAKFQYSSQIFYLIPIFFLRRQLLMKPKNKKNNNKKTPLGPLQMISDQSFLPLPIQNSGSFLKAWRFTHGEECCLCRGIKMC